jgi:diketogulonate reductase-like aldo/keto reductase
LSLSRRKLLKLSAGAGVGLFLNGATANRTAAAFATDGVARPEAGDRVTGAAESARSLLAPITKPIPSSGERIPIIGLGSSQTFNLAPGNDRYVQAQTVVRIFRELGGTVIDSSPTYQRSEMFVGETIRQFGIEKEIFVATKVNVGSRGIEAATRQMEQSLQTYGKDPIDLIQVWNLGGSIRYLSNATLPEHMEALQAFRKAGHVRYIGITTSRDPQYADVEAAMRDYTMDFVQLDYSIGDRIPEQRLLPLAREKGIAILANRPFTTGNLFGRVAGKALPDWAADIDCTSWAQFFLKFVASHPAVTCVIPATGDPAHLRDNMGAGTGRLPDDRMRTRMIELFATL